MATYQNIFTQVQLRPAELDMGVAADRIERSKDGGFSYWLGLIGNAQVGPIYLGYLGVLSLMCGFTAFEIIGLNMLGFGQLEPDSVLAPTPLAGARAAEAGIWDQHHAAPQSKAAGG